MYVCLSVLVDAPQAFPGIAGEGDTGLALAIRLRPRACLAAVSADPVFPQVLSWVPVIPASLSGNGGWYTLNEKSVRFGSRYMKHLSSSSSGDA